MVSALAMVFAIVIATEDTLAMHTSFIIGLSKTMCDLIAINHMKMLKNRLLGK